MLQFIPLTNIFSDLMLLLGRHERHLV